ncbi:ATP-dependent helicase [Peptoniphilaceae bacterium SGI.131]
MNNKLLENLNDKQLEAVVNTEGPILILAGAGSGKTRVLTTKIAYLIEERGVRENNILAFTFTNKAAKEMKERVEVFLNKDISHMWIGTFHSICSRLLRKNIHLLGYKQNFTIYDSQDSKTLIKEIMKDLSIDEKYLPVNMVISKISDYKNRLVSPVEVIEKSIYERESQIGEIYKKYEARKKNNNALDFDDLILKTLELFTANKELREHYADIFSYVFVDEYQDTNKSQYELIKLLSYKNKNICVVGDSDQSIYSWRGADITNILNFEKDFKDAKVILLEQNYRSTSKILDAANELIRHNEDRREKNLWTQSKGGADIVFKLLNTEYEEANQVIQNIYQMNNDGVAFKDMAILYRTNAQSRVLEEKLMAEKIPHKVIGGLKFYDRREVKDIIAYLSFIANPDDNLAFKRIVNMPKRGLGDTSVSKLEAYANATNQSIYDAVYDENIDVLSKATLAKFRQFTDFMTAFINLIDSYNIVDLVEEVFDQSGYKAMLESSKLIEDRSRIENISALISAITEFDRNTEDARLNDYLQSVSLLSDVDKTSDESAVSLMTIHAAKGLEYDVVYLTGMEDGLFPSLRALEEGGLEEERRLCYVAVTRAKKRLYIYASASRMTYGKSSYSKKSRFLEDMSGFFKDESKVNGNIFEVEIDLFEEKRSRYKADIRERKARIEEAKNQEYSIGDRVSHKKFGVGMIVQIKDAVSGKELLISFEKNGIKRLNSKIAPLEKL